MQELEPNMEDLFRSAAEFLPLKDEDNWQQVADKISAQTIVTPPALPEKKNRRKYLVLLLMLLFLITASWWLIDYKETKILTPVPGKVDHKNYTANNQNIKIENLNNAHDPVKEKVVGLKKNNTAEISGRKNGDEIREISLMPRSGRNKLKIFRKVNTCFQIKFPA